MVIPRSPARIEGFVTIHGVAEGDGLGGALASAAELGMGGAIEVAMGLGEPEARAPDGERLAGSGDPRGVDVDATEHPVVSVAARSRIHGSGRILCPPMARDATLRRSAEAACCTGSGGSSATSRRPATPPRDRATSMSNPRGGVSVPSRLGGRSGCPARSRGRGEGSRGRLAASYGLVRPRAYWVFWAVVLTRVPV